MAETSSPVDDLLSSRRANSMHFPYIRFSVFLVYLFGAAVLGSWTLQTIDPGLTHLNGSTSHLTEMGREGKRRLILLASSTSTKSIPSSFLVAPARTPTTTFEPAKE